MKRMQQKTIESAVIIAGNGVLMTCVNGYPGAHFWVCTGDVRGEIPEREKKFVCQHCGEERWFPCSQIPRRGLWGGKGKKKGGRKKPKPGENQ